MFVFRKQTEQVLASIESSAHNLGLLSLLIERLERERFSSPGLVRLHGTLATEGAPAALRIKHLNRWLDLLDSSDHILLRILGPVVLYRQQLVMAIEAWRRENGAHIGLWTKALAEFEALSSFGALHYERPLWNFPMLEGSGAPHFVARDLGHPLISASVSVRNNVRLDSDCRLLIVSGSNMSGKSTLLRAVGLNTVLAWAGAPVCATALSISPLQTGASLRVSDSLQDNRSRFFAEISRLRQVVDLTKSPVPVLFLLDELLSGTNSHDRRIGAAGIIRGLLRANTLGLLTTHDLALAQLDQDAGAAVLNVHFEDRITNGKMEFDYHLLPGVVTHSNALELMRSIGLEI
jgi:DNA mismatch repair ATPase MutS